MIMDEIEKFQQMKMDTHAKKAKAYKEVIIDKSAFHEEQAIINL